MVLDDFNSFVLEVKVDVEEPCLLILPPAEEPQNLRRVRLQTELGRRHSLVGPQWIRPLNLRTNPNIYMSISLSLRYTTQFLKKVQ